MTKTTDKFLKRIFMSAALTLGALALGLQTLTVSAGPAEQTSSKILYVIDGAAQGVSSTLSTNAGSGVQTDTIPSAAGGNYITTPNKPLVYTISNLTGTYTASQATQFSIYLDSLSAVGNGIAARISYDFTGDGTYDRVETYNYFSTDPLTGYELYTQARGLAASSGAFANLNNGRVRLELWNAIGANTALVRTSATSANGQQSRVTIPYTISTGPTATSTLMPTMTFTALPSQTPTTAFTSTSTPVATQATCGSSNVALGKVASSSSNENAGTAANLAVDGNTSTRWSSAFGDPQWIRVDLGSTQNICRVKLNWEAAYGSGYQIQVSNDATNWTPIYVTTTGNGGVDDLTGLSGSGRYVRMYGTTRATPYGYSLWEMEIYSGLTSTPTAGPSLTPSATASNTPIPFTPTHTATAIATNTQPAGAVVPLYNSSTALEPETIVDTGSALITRLNDRARDRHARESMFALYDHYLSHYWEHRTAAIEVVDRVAKGGSGITFNVTTQWKLSQPEFRAFYRGINTVAEYHYNAFMTQVSGPDANGVTNYTITVTYNAGAGRNIQIGDRMEIEISQFLDAPPTGRANYYGTTMLYIVGQGGMVPWEGQGPLLDSFPLPQSAWQGGRTTLPYQYSNEPLHRFKQMAMNIAPQNGQPFMQGRRLFHTNFNNGAHSERTNENGIFSAQVGKLGPRFYTPTCDSCHTNDGGALPPAVGAQNNTMVVKVGTVSGAAHPNFGTSLQPSSTSGAGEGTASISSYTLINGTYGDGTAYQLRKPNYSFSGTAPANFSVRRTPHLVGMGLLEAVAESTISGIADPNDSNGDGISGRMSVVIDPQTGQLRMGRFGWKAGQATVLHQIAAALNGDMGVTTSIFPNPDCGSAQTGCGASGIEVNDLDMDNLRRYISLLGVAARRNLNDAQAQRGETLFAAANCTACHTPTLTTSAYAPFTELRSQTIHAYTDLLLHDMGPDLADNLPEGGASGAEWRTAPLWSLGLTAGVNGGEAYLHDGRARTVAEAILWHGGEAFASREAFRNMNAADRAALILFLLSQ